MKKQMRWLLFGVVLATGFLLAPQGKMQAEAAVKLNASSVTIKQGESKKLKVRGSAADVLWTSSNENVITVNKKGRITAVKGGKAVVSARVGSKVLTCKVTSAGLNASTLTIAKGSTYQLRAKKTKSLKWTSRDTKIAKVTAKGVVKAKKKGHTVIRCKTKNGTVKCKVYVARLNKTSLTLNAGSSYPLRVTETGHPCKWTSSNEAVAVVDENGLVTAMDRAGTVKITCKTGKAVLTCAVKVQTPDNITTPKSELPSSSKVDRLDVTVESYPTAKTYTIYNQAASVNKTDGTNGVYTGYMPNHGCGACALTTVLSGYTDLTNLSPQRTTEVIEKKRFGSDWTKNYSKAESKQMPISLYGITKVLNHYDVPTTYVRSFTTAAAKNEIKAHLMTGNAVVVEVRKVGNDTTWSNSYHTMVLLGMTDDNKVIVADSVNRDGFGNKQRIKYTSAKSLLNYMFSCTNLTSTAPYFSSSAACGGYILVNPQG